MFALRNPSLFVSVCAVIACKECVECMLLVVGWRSAACYVLKCRPPKLVRFENVQRVNDVKDEDV